jgi:Putative adhesin
MRNGTFIAFILLLTIGCPVAFAQEASTAPASSLQKSKPPKAQKPETAPEATPEARAEEAEHVQVEPISVKLGRGGKVAVSSRSGRIVVSGWDRDVVQASATGENGAMPLETETTGDASRPRLLLSASPRRGKVIRIELKVPRYADVETLEGSRGAIEVADIDGATLIDAGDGDVHLTRVGSVKVTRRTGDVTVREVKGDLTVRSFSGEIVVESIHGVVDVAATNGDLRVHDAGGDVRANSATGDIEIRCAKGRADASSASGSVTLIGIGGDAEASTASGDVIFRGPIRGGSYRLKSLSGEVSMTIQPDAPGFVASLTTYNGQIETDFPLKIEGPLQGPINRRITGRYGDGQAKISLDSFSGAVKIAKGTAAELNQCK